MNPNALTSDLLSQVAENAETGNDINLVGCDGVGIDGGKAKEANGQ
jgi:hypothetical protein